MKTKSIIVSLILCLGLAVASVNLTGCAAGGSIGGVGGSASIG